MMGSHQSIQPTGQAVVSFLPPSSPGPLGVSARVEWWDYASGRGAPPHFLCPIINHIGRISCQVRSDVSEGQENGLHVVPLASALVKSLTELDLRWAFLAVQMPSWFFLLCV